MEFDEAMMRCQCPATHYYTVNYPENWDETTEVAGECVEIQPCG
jgi:hypothetical protein